MFKGVTADQVLLTCGCTRMHREERFSSGLRVEEGKGVKISTIDEEAAPLPPATGTEEGGGGRGMLRLLPPRSMPRDEWGSCLGFQPQPISREQRETETGESMASAFLSLFTISVTRSEVESGHRTIRYAN
uniref:Uncharacterized protein n=1 Tax=Vespula pensylvanica TaxID=30213 RepID=A0A834P3R7_VESPE|nr:hypothetical protein H0235_006835 [Vespula pensylvanica]